MVRKEKLELSRREALEPKSSVSTNSTTPASGVDDGARTHDRRNHNPELYQLSYAHHWRKIALYLWMPNGALDRIRTCDPRLRRPLLYPAELRALYEFAITVPISIKVVGETGFEPATPWTQTKCATKLRYSPTFPAKTFASRYGRRILLTLPYLVKHFFRVISRAPNKRTICTFFYLFFHWNSIVCFLSLRGNRASCDNVTNFTLDLI